MASIKAVEIEVNKELVVEIKKLKKDIENKDRLLRELHELIDCATDVECAECRDGFALTELSQADDALLCGKCFEKAGYE